MSNFLTGFATLLSIDSRPAVSVDAEEGIVHVHAERIVPTREQAEDLRRCGWRFDHDADAWYFEQPAVAGAQAAGVPAARPLPPDRPGAETPNASPGAAGAAPASAGGDGAKPKFRRYTTTEEQAAVIDQALGRVREAAEEPKMKDSRALEFVAAEYLAGH